jgi:hypothetical protein
MHVSILKCVEEGGKQKGTSVLAEPQCDGHQMTGTTFMLRAQNAEDSKVSTGEIRAHDGRCR